MVGRQADGWMDVQKSLSTFEKSVQQPKAVSEAPDTPESHTWDFSILPHYLTFLMGHQLQI